MTGAAPRHDGCGEIPALLPEFALGVLTGATAAEVVEHTARCVDCRTALVELSGVPDALLVLAPEREPDPTFTARVSAAIDAQPKASERSRRRRVWITAAAAAAVVALVAGGVLVGRATAPSGTEAASGPAEVSERTMVGVAGRAAGHVYLSRGEPGWALVSVDYGALPPGEYSVSTSASGTGATVGRISVDAAGRGSWGGTLAGRPVDVVRIVDDDGHVLCEARFGPGQSLD